MERRSPSAPPGDALPEDPLRLDLQLCFRLYAASRLITRLYQPMLEPHGLTYPQYIVLMILWEEAPCSVSRIGARALLNTNTLTPLLKRLEQQGLVQRQRRQDDERIVEIHLPEAGHALRSHCDCIPAEIASATHLPLEKAMALATLLDELLAGLRDPSLVALTAE